MKLATRHVVASAATIWIKPGDATRTIVRTPTTQPQHPLHRLRLSGTMLTPALNVAPSSKSPSLLSYAQPWGAIKPSIGLKSVVRLADTEPTQHGTAVAIITSHHLQPTPLIIHPGDKLENHNLPIRHLLPLPNKIPPILRTPPRSSVGNVGRQSGETQFRLAAETAPRSFTRNAQERPETTSTL